MEISAPAEVEQSMSLPAAKKGDQVIAVDAHIVLVPAAAGAPIPTPLPHPFSGVIDDNLSADVKIMGLPAAILGSTATNSPAHIPIPPGTSFSKPPSNRAKILTGSTSVFVNGKPAIRATDTALTCNDPVDLPAGKVVVVVSTVLIGGPSMVVSTPPGTEKEEPASGSVGKQWD